MSVPNSSIFSACCCWLNVILFNVVLVFPDKIGPTVKFCSSGNEWRKYASSLNLEMGRAAVPCNRLLVVHGHGGPGEEFPWPSSQ